MIDITNLRHLNQYTNFETFKYNDKVIVLYDDHRCILTALYEARKLGVIDQDTSLITFDRHDDARPVHVNKEIIAQYSNVGINNVSRRDFMNFVEFDIREYDDDWVCVGMELGLINNIVNVGNIDGCNIAEWKDGIYVDNQGKNHHGQLINHLHEELSRVGGALGDIHRYEDSRIVRDILNYNIPGKTNGFSNVNTNFVLDFDLDCFTTECHGWIFAWPEVVFNDLYGYGDTSAGYLMQDIIQRAKLITICREPSYCGGIGESNKILSYLDKYFFQGCLKTKAI